MVAWELKLQHPLLASLMTSPSVPLLQLSEQESGQRRYAREVWHDHDIFVHDKSFLSHTPPFLLLLPFT